MEVDSLLNDFNRELSDYSKECEFSEEELYETENRLNAINHLKVKYGNTIEEILDYQAEQKAKLEKLQDYEAYLARLKRDLEQSESLLEKHSQSLSKARKSRPPSWSRRWSKALES